MSSDLRLEVDNMAFRACTMKHIQYKHYRNSSVIADLVMGQIPRSTERISS